jgi:hypothetical protein
MVEQARLFNLLVDHISQGQPNTSNTILPPSKLPMDLIKEERKGRSNKRVLSEIDVSEWEITYKEICSREGKLSYNSGKTTQLLEGETRSQAEILGTQKGKKLCIIKKDQQQVSKPKELPPRLFYNCEQPGHFKRNCSNPKQHKPNSRIRTLEQLNVITARSRPFKPDELYFMGNISIRPRFLISIINANDRFS